MKLRIQLNNNMRLMMLMLMPMVLMSCAPVPAYAPGQTKYPDVPTMQAAQDAGTDAFDARSFDR
jgi:hypothetical protein